MYSISRILCTGISASLFIIGTSTPGGVFGKPAIENHQESPPLRDFSQEDHQEDAQADTVHNLGININQVNFHEVEVAPREKQGCLRRYRTTLVCGFIVCVIALPAIYELVIFIQNIKAKASEVADACATMQTHCDTLDQDCTLLTAQVKMVIQLLASLTRISPEEVTCILSCSQTNGTISDRLSCIALCIKA